MAPHEVNIEPVKAPELEHKPNLGGAQVQDLRVPTSSGSKSVDTEDFSTMPKRDIIIFSGEHNTKYILAATQN
jgi:hypothetical protein